MPRSPFAHVWKRLGAIGFPKPFVRDTVLPDWWDEAMVQSQAGYEQSIGLLANRLGVTHASLRDPDARVAFRADAPVCFKLKNGTTSHEVSASQAFAVEVARLVLKGVPVQPLPAATAAEVRAQILDKAPIMSLDALLDWCWGAGIPVAHVNCRSVKGRTMDAMAIRVNGRYAAVLNRHEKSPARLLFHLAHELGHLLLGHLDADGVIADEGIADGAEADVPTRDVQEQEANAFAVALLTGSPHTVYKLGTESTTATLVRKAREKGDKDRLSPAGVVLLNTQYLREQYPGINPWGRALRALKELEPEADAPAEINAALGCHLDWAAFSDDQMDYLQDLLHPEADLMV